MKNLRRNFERFCYRHQNKGIPNLMLYLSIIRAVVYFVTMVDPSNLLYRVLDFDWAAILHGEVWRLITYILLPTSGNLLDLALSVLFNYYMGRMIESVWGTFRLNLFYFSGVVITDIAALLLRCDASVFSLNLSLLLAFATLYPEVRILIFYIIPVKMKYLAWFYFGFTIYQLIAYSFPYNLFCLFALLNYFLFFGSDVLHVLPDFLQPRRRSRKLFQNFGKRKQKPNANWSKGYSGANGQQPYHHKCTVCGSTDAEYPNLEFRYCSKCNGYYCYCIDHINNHAHIP